MAFLSREEALFVGLLVHRSLMFEEEVMRVSAPCHPSATNIDTPFDAICVKSYSLALFLLFLLLLLFLSTLGCLIKPALLLPISSPKSDRFIAT